MAINLDPENAVYYSNRSAAHAGLGDWTSCLEDSNKTIELRPEWFKGYTRLAFGFSGLKMYKSAEEQYQKAAGFDDAPESVHTSLARATELAGKSNASIEVRPVVGMRGVSGGQDEKKWLMDQQAEENKRKMAEAGCAVM